LANAGLTDEQIDRLHGPIGISISAQSPEEIAISILAEMIQAKNTTSARKRELVAAGTA
jgi:xanthine dehydrogenase accessory factor